MHTAFAENGTFDSSDAMLNTLQKHTLQSFKSNFTGIPTDCPHREKNGWTGDAALAAGPGETSPVKHSRRPTEMAPGTTQPCMLDTWSLRACF